MGSWKLWTVVVVGSGRTAPKEGKEMPGGGM